MLLTIDIGNTNITIGVFEKDKILKIFHTSSKEPLEKCETLLKQIKSNYKISDCILSSVVDEITFDICKVIESVFDIKPLTVSSKLNLGFNIVVGNPYELGADRIVNSSAVKKIYGYPAIVVDSGSATTFDVIDKNGDFIGGLIMPGINMQIKSLAENTSKLPLIDIKKNEISKSVINTDTIQSILTGVVKGQAKSIEGLLEDCKKELGYESIVVLTGGNAELLVKYIDKKYFNHVNPNLTIEGLRILYELNKS